VLLSVLFDETATVAEHPYTLEPRWRALVGQQRFSGRTRVLLVNATKGRDLYKSLVDFFLVWRALDSNLHITSASYFSEIYELGRGVLERGVPTLSIEALAGCTLRQLNMLDLIICIGPSEAFARLASLEGLTARLVLLDLAFYHRVMAVSQGRPLEEVQLASGEPARNPVAAYSAQPAVKVFADLDRMGIPAISDRWTWHWLSYLPLGLSRHLVYRVSPPQFDVLVLGGKNRDFSLLDAADLEGLRILFLGKLEHTEQLRQCWGHLDITVRSKVPFDEYHRIIAASRCVLIPFEYARANCFLSVADSLAAGTPLLLTRHIGSERLESLGAPISFVDRGSLGAALAEVLSDTFDREAHRARSRAFSEAHLDIGSILFRILQEQLEPMEVPTGTAGLEAPCPSSL
jgi:hypothetical protein